MPNALPFIATVVLAQRDGAAFENALAVFPDLTDIKILSPELAFEGNVAASVTQKDIQTALEICGVKADICIQRKSPARKKMLLICDMDSTLIGQECIDELADFAGVKDRVSAITERAMRGEIGFDGALTERVGLLAGLDLSVLEQCFKERISLNDGARTLCQTMTHYGAKAVIVSGGFTFFTGKVAAACGFGTHQANTLIDDGMRLTGKVGMPILGREAKREALEHHSKPLGGPETAIAIGDGANDLAMIQSAGLGVAFYAKPAVAAAAQCTITYTDLRSALYFQGYKESEFIS